MFKKPHKKLKGGVTAPVALLASAAPGGISPGALNTLASQAAFILAVDAGAEQLAAAGLVPDMLIGDFDSLSPDTLQGFKDRGVVINAYDTYKDATDIELGIETLCSLGYQRVIATNVLGGRSDHALGSLGVLAGAVATQAMEVAICDEDEVCFFAHAHTGSQSITLDFSPEDTSALDSSSSMVHPLVPALRKPKHLSLISWGGSASVSLTGTEWELTHFDLSPYSSRGVSNLACASTIQLKVHEGDGTVLMLLHSDY